MLGGLQGPLLCNLRERGITMILILAGASHTGKTLLAQRLLEQLHWPYFSIDHLKMGLIRSGMTDLTVFDDEKMTEYLWPILREMIKTAIENNQNLILEGCYVPFDWAKDFDGDYLSNIRCRWLIMTRRYIETHYERILGHANAIEQRLPGGSPGRDELIGENERNLACCLEQGCDYVLIDQEYPDALWKEVLP